MFSSIRHDCPIYKSIPNMYKPSLLRRLQGTPSPAEAPPIGKIRPFSKMAVTFEPLMGF